MKGLIIRFRPIPASGGEAGWYLMSAFSNSSPIFGLAPAQLRLSLQGVAPECNGGTGKGLLSQPSCPFARLIKRPLGSWIPSSFVGFWSLTVAQLLFQVPLIVRLAPLNT